jgi:uncharacterized protein YjbJ (UPF0337 family)
LDREEFFNEEGLKMNWPEVQSNWTQSRMVLKTQWPNLTDADLDEINGIRDRLTVALQRRYALTTDEAARQVAAFEEDVRFAGAVK